MHRQSFPPPTAALRTMSAELWSASAGVLDINWSHDHMIETRHPAEQQSSWDAAFIAIGLAYLKPARAWRDLRTIFETQWPDGRVPQLHDQGTPTAGTGLIQPPLHAMAAWEVYRRSAAHGAEGARQARSELAWLYPRLAAQQAYLAETRDAGGAGLASIVHPSESGMADSPSWDDPLTMLKLRDPSGPRDAAALARSYRNGGYADAGLAARHPFVVECPAFNAILGSADLALARIADVVGADAAAHRRRARRITTAIVDTLWDSRTSTFRARDVRTGLLSQARCISGLLPLILPDLPTAEVNAIMTEARSIRFGLPAQTGLPVPGYDRTAADFDAERDWRGPIWININWLLRRGMLAHGFLAEAENMRTAMMELVHRAGHFERYHPDTGEGIGASSFSWTAALVLDLLADRSIPAHAHAA